MANLVLRGAALLLVASALALLFTRVPDSTARDGRAPCERCNVVLISFDTVRADHLGAYGYDRPTSPNVDKLASESVVFENAISQAPWTLPAHASMLSGLYGSRLGVVRYPATRILSDQNQVLPEVFRAAGYATAGFTGGGFVSDHYGFDRGFDLYESRGRRYEHNLDATIDWLQENKGKPFFLFFHGYDAHRPYYSKPVDKKALDIPPDAPSDQGTFCLRDDRERPSDERLARIVRYYDASIHHGDRAIGVLLDTLAKLGLMENTVILLTSDHGEEFFEHGNCDHVRFVYNESVHVPYMIRIPRQAAAPSRIPGLVPASISVARTLLDVVGIDNGMPGVTLLPILEGKQKSFPVVYSEADSAVGILGSRGRTLAMTKADTKLVSYPDEGSDEAYLLLQDPGEKQPLPERHVAYLMRQTLRAWSESVRPLPRPDNAPSPEDVAAMDGGGTGGEDGGEAPPSDGTSGAGPQDGASGKGGDAGSGKGAGKPAKGAGKAKNPKMPEELKESLRSLGYLE